MKSLHHIDHLCKFLLKFKFILYVIEMR